MSLPYDDGLGEVDGLKVGDIVVGRVAHHSPFGFWVDHGRKHHSLVELNCFETEKGEKYAQGKFPPIGTEIRAKIISIWKNGEIRLGCTPEILRDGWSRAKK